MEMHIHLNYKHINESPISSLSDSTYPNFADVSTFEGICHSGSRALQILLSKLRITLFGFILL